jgi:ABC-type lipoprotein export system ATPase subunit
LFLENPLDKIDEENSKEILDYLCEEQQPWTLVVVSKNNYWKKICKQRIVLEKGALKAE